MSEIVDRIAFFAKHLRELEDEWMKIKAQVDGRIARMKLELDTVAEKRTVKRVENSVKSQAKEQSGNFPYPVGKVVKVAFPELFKRKLVNAGDIAYLMSKKASKDFRTRGYAILRLDVGADDPGLYSCGHRRFFKMAPMELGAKKYHLSSQFYPESRDAVLKWIYSHGLKKSELISLIEG
jgi:hypothetical protein